jgi:hypothetical protein
MTEPLLTDWITQWRDDLQATTPSTQSYQQIKDPLAINVAALNQVAERLYQRWTATITL